MKYIIRDYSTKPCGLDEAINRIAKSHPREAMCEVLATWNVDCNSDKPGADIGKVERAYMLFVRTLAEYCLLSLKGDDIELMMGCDMQKVPEQGEEEAVMKKDELIVTPTVKLSEEDIENIVVTALEGGIGYWACLNNTTSLWDRYKKVNPEDPCSIVATKMLLDGHSLQFNDSDDGDLVRLFDLKNLMSGFKKYITERCLTASFLEDELDSQAADIIWQYGMFGELVYS